MKKKKKKKNDVSDYESDIVETNHLLSETCTITPTGY